MDTRYRLGGLLSLLVAAFVAWLGIWRPLQQASDGAATVTWIPRVAVVVALAVVWGLFFLVTGARYPYRDEERQTLTPVGWTLLAIVAVVALAGFFGTTMALESMGYHS